MALNKRRSLSFADGIGSLETKVSNASLIARVMPPSWLHKSRETAKGAADSELGDLLFLIILSEE